MNTLLNRLAQQLAIAPLSADEKGRYRVTIAGHDLILEPTGLNMTVRSVLPCTVDLARQDGLAAAQRALGLVTSWGRRQPQALAMDPDGRWVVEARLELASLDYPTFEAVLDAHVDALEALRPVLEQTPGKRHGGALAWRP
ncbi:YscB family type III secretion system chaperone [Pseudomonas entomophila]|uniref:YscB family type III secretion system chaperone n=1 Tax=Pseudomonas entomophila TaxID=312306 RepID=UPI001F008CB4|nr:YscB family type III secretion system chaperone [Pseudomonas entomophila]MCG8291438.1 YscB family type III secretion system chaperone [Pseudomonas entomophila]